LSDKPKIDMQIQPDNSALFSVRDNITIRVAFESPTQVRVEMWREGESTFKRVAPDVGNVGTKPFRERLARQAREVFNPPPDKDDKPSKDTVPNLDEDLGHIAGYLGIPEVSELLKPEAGTTMVDRLVELVEEAGTLFTTPEGEPHAALSIDGHVETHEIRGTRFRRWIRGHFYATERNRLEAQAEQAAERLIQQLGGMLPPTGIPVKKPAVVRDQTLSDAIAQLEAKADYERRVEEAYVRVGHHDGKIYVDLGSDKWEVVEIGPEGWHIIDTPPIRFVRPKGMLELPHPEKGGALEDFKNVLPLSDSEEDTKAWTLIAAFLMVGLRPDHPEFPIMIVLGPQESGKSVTCRMIRNILDPNKVEDTGSPRSMEELHIDAECSWLLGYDNLTSIPGWLSDALCRISTGSAFTKRTHYTNRDREIFTATQPQIMNGIADVVSKGDIVSRGLMVTLSPPEERREKSEVWKEFFDARPKILGALYDAVATGLKSEAEGEEVELLDHRMPTSRSGR